MGEVIKLSDGLLHPRDYVAPSTDNAQTRGAINVIQKLSQDQIFENSGQGTGIAGPSVWGGPTDDKAVQSSADAGRKQSGDYSVDLKSGQNSCWNNGKVKSNQ
jgi:hypothetical protein